MAFKRQAAAEVPAPAAAVSSVATAIHEPAVAVATADANHSVVSA